MKKILFAVLALATLFVSSCNKPGSDDPYYVGVGMVTLRPQADGSFYMKAREDLALVAINQEYAKYPYKDGKEHRAIIQFGYDPEEVSTSVVPGYEKTQDVTLFSVDTLRTKLPLVYEESKDADYGDASIGLYLTDEVFPSTCIEDGYLNVSLALPCGYEGVTHTVNLLTGVDPDDPYTVELRHNANGDVPIEVLDVYPPYCFPLKSLPDTEGKTVKLTLKWKSLVSGEVESFQFDYCTRTDW